MVMSQTSGPSQPLAGAVVALMYAGGNRTEGVIETRRIFAKPLSPP
jgi:hypothetical protein